MQEGFVTSSEPEVPDEQAWIYDQDVTDRLHALLDHIEKTMADEESDPLVRRNLVSQEVQFVLTLLDDVAPDTRRSVLARLEALALYQS